MKSGFCQSMTSRVGASRLPSFMRSSSDGALFENRLPFSGRRALKMKPADPSEQCSACDRPVSEAHSQCAGTGRIRPRARASRLEAVERLLEASGVALLGLGQGFEPVGDLVEA